MAEWQPVRGYERNYLVSDTGEVCTTSGRALRLWKNHNGYWLARLSGPRSVARVHRLVAEAFIPNPDGKPFVNHLDNDPGNNCAENLEWCTQKENLAHARAQGRMPDNYWKGRRSPVAALTDDQVRLARNMYREGGWSLATLGAEFNVSKRSMQRVVSGERYADVR